MNPTLELLSFSMLEEIRGWARGQQTLLDGRMGGREMHSPELVVLSAEKARFAQLEADATLVMVNRKRSRAL